ncbi:MAG: LytTR family DNA-binding domain-containing protein [Bacteroidota bacterium]
MNCIIVDDDFASRTILKELVQFVPGLELLGVCESAIEAVEVLKDEPVDLIFLDINMPEMTGLELIESLREKPQIILITGNAKHATTAFEYDVADYILKPVEKARFLQAVDKARTRFEQAGGVKEARDYIFIKKDGVITKVMLHSVINIEAMADYIIIHTDQGKYHALSTMHGIEARLPKRNFVRVHRSHIINLHQLDSIEEGTAVLGDKMIPIGNTYRQRLYRTINLI